VRRSQLADPHDSILGFFAGKLHFQNLSRTKLTLYALHYRASRTDIGDCGYLHERQRVRVYTPDPHRQ